MTKSLTLSPQLIGDIARLKLHGIPPTIEDLQRDQQRRKVAFNRGKWINALAHFNDRQIHGRWFGTNDAGDFVFCAQGLAIWLAGGRDSHIESGEAKRIGMAFLGVGHDAWQRIANRNDGGMKFAEIAWRAERGEFWPVEDQAGRGL